MGSTSDKLVPFGRAMLEQFPLDPSYKNLNHGSFGNYPKAILKKFRELQDEEESSPDAFIRYKYPKYLTESRKVVAKALNAPTNTVVYVKNATTGVNAILRNLVYQPGDIVVYFSSIYAGVEKTIAYLAETTPLRARKVVYEFPITHEELVEKFIQVIKRAKSDGLNVKLAVFDTVVSQPGVLFPYERLVEVCREEGILSCVDAAHGIGHIPLDLSKLDPDFFVSNCHKWLFTPRGCAVMYVPIRHQHLMRSGLPTSHGFVPLPGILAGSTPDSKGGDTFAQSLPPSGSSSFETLFEFVATNDNIPYLCIPDAVKFREEVCGGEEKIINYLQDLAHDAGNLVAQILGTEVLSEAYAKTDTRKSEVRRCAFANVRLPLAYDDGTGRHQDSGLKTIIKNSEVNAVSRWIEYELTHTHKTFVPTYKHAGWMWVRMSAQIYLELDDFKWLGEVLKGLCEQVTLGKALENIHV